MKKGLVQHLQTSQKSHGRSANEVHIFITAELAPTMPRYSITEPEQMDLLTTPTQAMGGEQKIQGAHRADGEKGSRAG